MAYRRIILPEAQREYRQIVSYLVDVLRSPAAAKGFMDEFDRKLDLVCECPDMFSLSRMPELAVYGYRPILINNYVALVQVHDDAVCVAHLFHQTQDYARLV